MAKIRASSALGSPASRTEQRQRVRPLGARRRAHLPTDDPARWMISYADFMTLLLAFFVLLYAHRALTASPDQPQGELGPVAHAVEAALGLPDSSARAVARADPKAGLHPRLLWLASRLQTAAEPAASMEVAKVSEGVELTIASSALFASASAEIDYRAVPLLGEVGRLIVAADVAVAVIGHTDSRPIRTSRYPSNWELSANRAAGVARLLMAHGVPGERVTVAARAQTEPRASNETAAGRASNRRVVIRLRIPKAP